MLTAAIVLYNNDEKILEKAVNSFLATPIAKKLYLIDNSETDRFRNRFSSDEITYIYTGENLGFGKAHNLVLKEFGTYSQYHLILNPDAYFDSEVIPLLLNKLKSSDDIGLIAPEIQYPDGTFQKSIRRFPKLYDFLLRRVPGLKFVFKKEYERGNYLEGPTNVAMKVDAVSGCFQIFKTSVFKEIKGFDERYFMYMEDLDICRKVKQLGYDVLYFPEVTVYHHSAYGSKKSVRLFRVHLSSIVRYFMKWGI